MKKNILLLCAMFLIALTAVAQQGPAAAGRPASDLPVVYLRDDLTVHLVSPEPIRYVDFSSPAITGDLPLENVLRIKYRTDSLCPGKKDGVVTIITPGFIAQYRIVYCPPGAGCQGLETQINITARQSCPFDLPGAALSTARLRALATDLVTRKPGKFRGRSKASGMEATLNHVYTLGGYIFLDLGFVNRSNLDFRTQGISFAIEDSKSASATNEQSFALSPEFVLSGPAPFKKYYRDIFVFRQFSFTGGKVLSATLSEKQLSGRVITLKIPCREILSADGLAGTLLER
jgi:conjugative transposon TraN protein